MTNAHLRFGWLHYYKRTEKTSTALKLHLDRFIGEVLPDPPRRAKAHFISVVGGDTQIAAIHSAFSMADGFEIEGPEVPRVQVSLERNAQCGRGSVQVRGRKKPLRHLIAVSEEFTQQSGAAGRVILAASTAEFVWTSLAKIYGLPGVPEWAEWFHSQLVTRKAIVPLIGIGCAPVLIKGGKQEFLDWLSQGVTSGNLKVPESSSVQWPRIPLERIFSGSTKQSPSSFL